VSDDAFTADRLDCEYPGEGAMLDDARGDLRAALAAEQPQPVAFNHGICGDRYKVVRGSYWWHVRIGNSTANVGKFHSRLAAEDMAAKLRTAFLDGAFTQYEAAPPPPAAEPSADERRLRQLLCAARHGHGAYMDDGEASDISAHPWIDYLRDSLDEIDAKWQQRCRAALDAAAKARNTNPA
jgi:hypothetical protein